MRWTVRIAVLGATVLAVPAFGSASASAAGPPLTLPELIAQGDAICMSAGKKASSVRQPKNLTQFVPWATSYITVVTDMTSGLRALVPPPEVSALYARLLSLIGDHWIADLTRLRAAARAHNTRRYRRQLRLFEDDLVRSTEVGYDIGFKNCGR